MKTLTDEQLNAAICELRGWKRSTIQTEWEGWCAPGDDPSLCATPAENLPNHITGKKALGRMHKAESWLDTQDVNTRSLWLDQLALQCEWPTTKNAAEFRFEIGYIITRANARKRAIALLRVAKPEIF